MANPFDQFGYAEQGPEDEPTPAKSVDSNPFDQFGYEEEPAAPPAPPEPESMWDKTKRLGTALGSGAGEEASKMRTTLALAASAPAVLYGKIQELWGDPKYANLGDVAFKQFVDPSVQSVVASQLPPNATTAEKVLHGVGATATMIGEVVATGGGAAPEMLAQQTAEEGVTAATSRLVGEQVKHGAQSMQVPAVSSAIDAGRQSLEKTGDKATAIKVAQATYLQNVLAGTVPLAKQGGLVTRALSGAASGAASAEAGRQVQNAVVPDSEQTPFSLEDTAIAGVQGGMMGAALGPRGTPSALGGEHAANSPVDAIETAHEQAMQQTAADGGDKLDQVLAGAKAATEHAAVHDEAFVAEITRQNAEQEAVARLQEQIAAQADMQTPEGMFANREVEQHLADQSAREEDFSKAQFQAEMQKGDSIQQQAHEEDSGLQTAPFENDVDIQQPLQTLGDYMPKTLGERRAAEGVQEKPLSTERVQPEKMDVVEKADARAQSNFEELLAKAARRHAMEDQGQSILDDMEESSVTPRSVSDKFWSETYHQLNDQGKKRFEKYAKSLGFKPGDTLAVSKDGTAEVAQDWAHVGKFIGEDLAPSASSLEGTERGYVSMMKWANDQLHKQSPTEEENTLIQARQNRLEKVKEIDEAAHEAATSPKNDLAEPTEAQIEAGNYKKGHVEVHGEDVTIENPKGSTRSGKTPEGREWSQEMQDHYGYIRRTEGADGDHVDTFVGDRPDSDKVYVVDQIDQRTGAFDEHKAMMGYPNQLAAVRAYKRNFGKDWKVGPVKEMSVPEFKEWAHNGDTKRALQPEKIHESTPASQADVEHMAGAESKRGEQDIRFALGEDHGDSMHFILDNFSHLVGKRLLNSARDEAELAVLGPEPHPEYVHSRDWRKAKKIDQLYAKKLNDIVAAAKQPGTVVHKLTEVEQEKLGARRAREQAQRHMAELHQEHRKEVIAELTDAMHKGLIDPAEIDEIMNSSRSHDEQFDTLYDLLDDRQALVSRPAANDVLFALGEDPDTQYERLGTSATSKRTFDETKSYYDTAHESASRIAGRTIPETKLAARRAAMQAPEKGIAVVKTGDSEWTVYNDREPGQVYTSERSAYDDVFGADADADARAEQDAKAPSGWESADSGLPSMTKEAAEEAVRNTFKNAPELNIHVHKDFASMPEGPVRERLEANKTSAKNLLADIANRVRGLYDPTADEVHIFANNHPDAESVTRSVLHEVVAHKGLKAILKDRMASTMQDVHDNLGIRDRRAMEDIAERYGIDLKEKSGQRLAAEEYIAKLAERSIESPILARVIAAVRAGLRRMGLVKGWSNEDIRALLRSSRKNLDEKSRAEAQADQRIRYALGEPDPIVEKDPKNPLSQLAKFGATMESQAKYSPGLLQKVRDSLANFGESKGRSAIQGFLGTIPRSKLPDFVGKGADGKSKLPAAQKYADAAHNMDNFRNRQLVADETIAKKWSKLQKRSAADAGNMGELMHAATLAGVDPAKEFEYSNPGVPQTKEMRAQDALRRQQYDALRPFWNRLSPDAKRLYEEVRDKYVEKRRMVQTFLEDRINDTDAPLDSKRVLLDTLRKHFESGSVKGPYFPLARFGEYWGSAKNNKGEVVAASRFESPQEQKTWREQFTKQGYVTDGGRNMDAKTTVGSINPEFVAKVTDLLGGKSDLADSVWQLYMQSLPEMSMRKAYIHRLGRLGFSGDALRAYGTNMFHMSHQIARLKYMHKMDGHLQQLEKQARTLESSQDPEAKWARPLVSEMNARHRWAMNPTSNPIVSALTSLGFAWHLVASPAAGVVNLTQTPMVAMPVLSAEFGFARTNRALLKAATEVAGTKLMSLGKQSVADRLKGDEQKAMLDAEANGSFGRTQAHMLAGATNEEGFDITSKRHQAMEIASWVFHNSEVFNRKVTFLAAFRLAKQKGMSYDDAFYTADKLNMDSHFDVSNANRARVMQSGVAKVLTLFKNYSLNMTYRLARDFREAVRTQTTDPATRTAAQKRFAGMMVMTATMAGTSGLPLAWLTHAVINTVFSDPDTDFDSEDAFRAHLTAAYGSKAATAITRGPFEAATGLSISDRVGLNNLWIQSPPENTEGEDLNRFYLEQAAGPALSPFLSVAPAAKLAGQGYYERSLERVLPKAGTDLVKTLRYARDGATDMHGNTLMPADEFSAKQLFFQSIGFVPEELATLNAQGRAVKGAEQKLHKRKELLIDKYFLASHNADKEGTDEALKDIMTFDKKNPTIAIGAANIVSSAKSRAKFNALAVEGTTVDPKLGYLHNRYKFTPKKETPKNDSED